MSKPEQIHRLDPWNTATLLCETNRQPCASPYHSEEDQVAWPPVIARIRDLDKPAVAENPSVGPVAAPPIKSPASVTPSKIAGPSRKGQNLSSLLIALAGVIIFLMAIVNFLPLRNNKPNPEMMGDTFHLTPPAPKPDPAPPCPASTATASDPTGKTSNQPSTNPSNTAATQVNSTPAMVPSSPATPPAPTLLQLAEKKETPQNVLPNPAPDKAANTPVEPTTAQTPASSLSTFPQPPAGNGTNPSQASGIETLQIVENREATQWTPPANPQKTSPMTVQNQTLRPSTELSNMSSAPVAAGYVGPPTNSNQPITTNPIPAPSMANVPHSPSAPWAQVPPSMVIPNGEYRNNYSADERNNLRPRWDRTPDYRKNPSMSNPLPPSGQPTGQSAGQPTGQLIPSGGQVPSMRQGVMSPQAQPQLQTQMPQQYNLNQQPYNPNQFAPPAYPPGQPAPVNPTPNQAANPRQTGGYPPPANNYSPNTVPAGTTVSPADYRDGFPFPATTGNPPRQ